MSDTEETQLNGNPSEQAEAETTETKDVAVDESPKDDSAQDTSSKGDALPQDSAKEEPRAVEAKSDKPRGTPAKREKAKSAAKADDEPEEAYSPGDCVQAKVLGYPWWPAIVVTPDHFPAAALAARPATKTRKDGSSAVFYPVQFLGAPEYYWSRSTDIKALPLDEVKAWLDSGKKSSTKGLKAAFQHALKTPSLEELMESKIMIESQFVEDEDAEMPDEEPEEVAAEDDSEDIDLDDEGKPIKKSKTKKKPAARTPKKTPSKTPTKKRKTDGNEDASAPSAKKSRATPKSSAKRNSTPSRQPSPPESPGSPEVSPEEAAARAYEHKKSNVMFVRHKLQKCLLGKACDETMLPDMPGYLKKLDPVEIDVQLLKETKIGKVLTRIRKLESIPEDEDLGIKTHVSNLLDKWQEAMESLRKQDDEEAAAKMPAENGTEKAHEKDAKESEKTDEKKETTEGTNGHAEESEKIIATETKTDSEKEDTAAAAPTTTTKETDDKEEEE